MANNTLVTCSNIFNSPDEKELIQNLTAKWIQLLSHRILPESDIVKTPIKNNDGFV